jgi:hypothetical protein
MIFGAYIQRFKFRIVYNKHKEFADNYLEALFWEANGVAHALAKHSHYHNLCCNWDDYSPSFFLDRLSHDVRII